MGLDNLERREGPAQARVSTVLENLVLILDLVMGFASQSAHSLAVVSRCDSKDEISVVVFSR